MGRKRVERGMGGNIGKPRVNRGKFVFVFVVERIRVERGIKNMGKPRVNRGKFVFVVDRIRSERGM